MNHRCRYSIGWAIGAAVALVIAPVQYAAAQYGGRSTGGHFEGPRDVRSSVRNYRAPQARPAPRSEQVNQADPYDPQTWLATRRGWSGDVQQAGGATEMPRGAVRQASHNRLAQHEEVWPVEDGMMIGPNPEEGYFNAHPPGTMHHHDGGCSSCGGGDCGDSCGEVCGDSCGGECGRCVKGCCVPCIFPDYFEVMGGVQGFKGPRDWGNNGNFGFHEGFNAAGPLSIIPNTDLSYQFGWQALQSNLSGTVFEEDYRRQYFLTAGVFHRQDCGLNYGVVYDWQRDQFYDAIDLNQLRGQVSLMSPAGREIGFLAAVATNDDLGQGFTNPFQDIPAATWEVNDQFVGFYRWNFDCGGDFRLFGGFTGSKDGVIGSDFHVPFNDCWSVAGGFTYVIPEEGNQGTGPDALGTINEQWNISLSLVYTFGKKARSRGCGTWKPMFDVADNGSMLVQVQEEED